MSAEVPIPDQEQIKERLTEAVHQVHEGQLNERPESSRAIEADLFDEHDTPSQDTA